MCDGTGDRGQRSALCRILPALQRLDGLLHSAVAAAQAAYGAEAALDPYRGLYVDRHEVERLLIRKPGTPVLWTEEAECSGCALDRSGHDSPLAWLVRAYGLSGFDTDVMLIALAPELDLRYERLYAYLQDDVARKRPTVDLVLNLLCPSVEAKFLRRAHFAPAAPLIRHGVLHLLPDPHQVQPPLLAHAIKLDEQIVRFLLGEETLDSRLAPFCQLRHPRVSLEHLPLHSETRRALRVLALQARAEHRPLRLYFYGPHGVGKRRTAEALAGEVGVQLLAADLSEALDGKSDLGQTLTLLFRLARFSDALLYISGLEALCREDRTMPSQHLLAALDASEGITILAGLQPRSFSVRDSLDVIDVPFPVPDFVQRRVCWQVNLRAEGRLLAEGDLDTLASRFRLTPEQIASAVVTARNDARWHAATQPAGAHPSPDGSGLTVQDLFVAVRRHCGRPLAVLAQKITPRYCWNDLVLPDDTLAQLREICQRVAHRHRVLDEWGFEGKLSLGKGVNALFAGPSGTGKTMAAEVIANTLHLDLYKIDLSGVVSKYIGETEKNLDRIFTAAENANAILFFDEADALFGRRSEVRDAHDRYANIEIAYLLQKMEHYEGIAILATNLRGNLDEAFIRRLAFTVHFPFPDEGDRRRIWTKIWPVATPVANEVDLGFLAHQFTLSGGNIKNIALAAAFLAAEDGGVVTMAHILRATQREYQKMGKVLTAGELEAALRETEL